ncbi:MAG: IS1380 family transposase, partial [Shimia sp.]|nr:IS1380 family transposase [Shimia sp.]
MVTDCNSFGFEFPACSKRKVAVDFSGGEITSNGGVLLLRQADRASGLIASVASRLCDKRQCGKVLHRIVNMLRQRVFCLALGYEDINDHGALRHDIALQTAAERDQALASPSTLSRFENAANRDWAWRIHEVMVDNFIASHSRPPKELILDFDATDDRVHGNQEGRFFHGYYDHYCFLPLYVFCGEQLLVSYLRPSKIDGAKHAWAILALLVKKLRQAWPEVRIILRADSGFCRHKMLGWCERKGVGYIVGLAKNKR